MLQSVHLMNQSVTSFLPCNFISSILLPSAKNPPAMVVNGTESSTMLMKHKKTFRAGLPLCRVSECILLTLLSYSIILSGSRLSPHLNPFCGIQVGRMPLNARSLANHVILSKLNVPQSNLEVQIWKVGSISILAFLVRFKRWHLDCQAHSTHVMAIDYSSSAFQHLSQSYTFKTLS